MTLSGRDEELKIVHAQLSSSEISCVQAEREHDSLLAEMQFEIEEKDGGEVQKTLGEKWKCPITGERLGFGSKAVYVVPCGHAFAGSVVKEVGESTCLTVCICCVDHFKTRRLICYQCN